MSLFQDGGSIDIKIWDAQLNYEDLPETRHEGLIGVFPPVKKFKDIKKKKFNKTFDDVIIILFF